MTHTVHPYAHRLGILRNWRSRWFAKDGTYQNFLRGDVLLREYLEARLRGFYVSAIEMERDDKTLRVIVKTSRPGLIIGRGGDGVEKLKKDITRFMSRKKIIRPTELKLDVEEVRSPESHAAIVAHMIAEGIEKRFPFRRILKQTAEKVMANRDVKGVRIALSGRLGGADMSRTEEIKKGRVPLQTLRADIDFARERAKISQGDIGIKVWIYRGEVFDEQRAR